MSWYDWATGWINWLIGAEKSDEAAIAALQKKSKPVALKIRVLFCLDYINPHQGPILSPGKVNLMASTLQMTDSQQSVLTVQEVDKAGNPTTAPLDAPPTWASSDTTVLTITPAADGMSATIAATGKLGTSQVTVSAAVAGVPLSGGLAVTIVAGAAASLVISAGTPTG